MPGKNILLMGICLLALAFVHGQPPLHITKVEADGLTNYYVKCITQDNNGFMWFGTEEGLFRFDGYAYRALKNFPGDSTSICNNNIEYLWPDKKGLLWAGTRGGLCSIDATNWQIKNYPSPVVFTVYSLVDEKDFFYVGTSAGLYTFSKTTHQWKRVEAVPAGIFIRSLSADTKGNLFVTSHQGVFELNTITGQCRHFSLPAAGDKQNKASQIAHRSFVAKDGSLWCTSWNAGLLKLESSGKFTAFIPPNLDKSLQEYRGTYDVLQQEDGTLWTANSENGITIIDTLHASYTSYPVQWDATKEIRDRVYALFRDKSGIVWIGTENGVYKIDPHSAYFSTINFFAAGNTKMLRPDFIALSFLKDSDGDWWIGSYDGLFLFDPVTGSMEDYSLRAGLTPGLNIFNLLQDSAGVIWLTNRNKLVKLIKTKVRGQIVFRHQTWIHSDIQTTIGAAKIDSHKKIWLGTHDNGIFMFDPVTEKFTGFPFNGPVGNLSKNEIHFFYELPDGNMLTGGERTGLLKLYAAEKRYERIDLSTVTKDGANATINAIAKDGQGYLWMGTEGNGLWQTDEQLKKFTPYTIRDGFPSMNISAITTCINDRLWMVSEGGVMDFCPLRKKLTLLDKSAGIRNLYNLSFIAKMDDGLIAIGDMGCIHLYNPAQAIKTIDTPVVMIAGLKIFDRPHPFYADSVVKLNYNQNYFSFDYVALDYTKPLHTQYAYMLEGVDTSWNNAGNRRYVSYTNLDGGSYTFKVKACNSQGVWSAQPATLHLLIRPPFWRSWWFYALLLLSAMLLLYGIYYVKRRQLLLRQQLQNKIARDLHDDIGSTLSGINIFSKLALQKLPFDPLASGVLLQRINTRTEKTMEALSDIVWSINTRNDNMENILSRMREYIGELIEPLGIQYELLTEGGISHIHIGMDIRKEVYLIFKEALHNASKYAACSFIRISIKKEDRAVLLCIEDNGKGFDTGNIVPGNGINNMRERAAKIGGSFGIKSQPGQGTSIRVHFPIT